MDRIVLRKIRDFYELSLAEMCELLGVSESHLCRVENGERPVTERMVRNLRDEIDLTPDKLTRILAHESEVNALGKARGKVRKMSVI
jgi:transcriptional regulator with XRE-family HTH domain